MLYGFRARAFAHALPTLGLAIASPVGGERGLQNFFCSPAGFGVAALALMAVGASVEETGTIKRIHLGVGIRLAGAALLLPAAIWAILRGAPSASLGTFATIVTLIGFILVARLVRYDAAVFADPRHGQSVQLESLSRDAIRLRVRGKPLSIPSALVRGASVASGLDGRATLIEIADRASITGEASALPWITRGPKGDTFVLTEHQAALDAEVLAVRVLEAAAAASEGGYR